MGLGAGACTGGLGADDRAGGGAGLTSVHEAVDGYLAHVSIERGLAANTVSAYGRDLGAAFQIADDLLDATVSAEEAGKRTGKDAEAGKATLNVTVNGSVQMTR